MTDQLRLQILWVLDQHSRTDPSTIKADRELAAETSQTLEETQRQLDILETQNLVTLTKGMGPTYGARITPIGSLAVERLQEQALERPRRPIGFRRSK